MKKNILEICLSPDLGGLELCTLDYFNYFKMQTNTYLCVAPHKKLDNYLSDTHKFTLKRNKLFPFISAYKLAKFIDKKEIDIVHFHWTRDIATVVFTKVFTRRKFKIVQSRHMTMTRFKDDFYHKWLYKNIDMIHAVTQQVKEQLIKFIPKDVLPKIEMLYLGVDEPKVDILKLKELKKQYNISDEFIVGIVGRIEEGKGQYIVINALHKLKDLNIKLLIVGSAMNEEYCLLLKQKIFELGLEEKVIFTGFTKDISEHIQLFDVSILATPKETFGLVIIESMVNKVPVIATAKGGPLEIIDDNKDGMLFDRTDDELAHKIKLLYNDLELKEKLSFNAYEKIKNKFDKKIQNLKLYTILEG